jgi:trimeric autotransporter adhesin
VNNTAVGFLSLKAVTDGQLNTGIGAGTLSANTGNLNTASGGAALFGNTTGTQNAASGALALFHNIDGGNNTADGAFALFLNTGGGNTASGVQALFNNSSGGNNTAVGGLALAANTTDNNNTAVGVNAGGSVTTAANVICIGALGANVSNSCYIGSIYGQSIDPATGLFVGIDANGKLGTVLSTQRFKRDIKRMDKASEAILALKPVTFHYNSDAKNTPCFGLVAEDVGKVNQNLVVRDETASRSACATTR